MVTTRPRPPAEPFRLGRIVSTVFVVALLALMGGGSLLLWTWSTQAVDTAGEVVFERELAIPALASSQVDEQGRRVFALTAQAGESDLGAGTPTETWGFNGDHLGPTLRVQRGEEVVVDVRNELPVQTSVHWHGMRLPARMDGGPHQQVEPGATWSPTWTVDQPAATLWYHPHPHGTTAEQVGRGLAGMVIVDDAAERALGLPRDYGVDDLPVIVQDVSLDGEGRLRPGSDLGETVLVNGTPGAYAEVTTERVRLRLLNASLRRTYAFGLDDGATFAHIGSDGGLLPAPRHTQRLQLSPGERAEVVVSLTPGERRVLRSYPPDLGVNGFTARFSGGSDTLDVMQLRAAPVLRPSPELPAVLAPQALDLAGDEASAVALRRFELNGREVNGARMDMARVDEVVTAGSTEVWEVVNRGGEPHNFHIHDVQFRVLSVGGAPAGPELAGLKDTVYLPPEEPLRLVMTFSEHADPHVPYLYHCHLLRHEDQGMMGQFLVVDPGAQPPSRTLGRPQRHDGH
jgi:blue copper oxidase